MRARTIKPGFVSNEDLCSLPFETRLLFAGLWLIADRSGRLQDRPAKIRAEIFPYDASVDVDAMLETLDSKGLIFRYILNESSYIQIPKWHQHQHPHPKEPDSVIPPIPCDLADFKGCREKAMSSRVKVLSSRAGSSGSSGPSGPSGSSVQLPLEGEEVSLTREANSASALFLSPANGTGKPKRGKGKTVTMSEHSRSAMSALLNLHPKNTIQVVSFRNHWADKVRDDQKLIDWLREQLIRECAGDTRYMLGPGKWLAEHLELYANGIQPHAEDAGLLTPEECARIDRENGL